VFEYRTKVIRVLDGDTAEFSVDLGLNIHSAQILRLYGINAPETNSSDPIVREKAKLAKEHIARVLIGEPNVAVCQQIAALVQQGNLVAVMPLLSKVVVPVATAVKVQTVKPYSTDKYGRWLGSVYYRTATMAPDEPWINLNEEMVSLGLAVPYFG
jgi:endonuclease YncB( thermonuclease family)